MKQNILNVVNGAVVDGRKPVHLRGVNFGGWLMMEGYFMHAPNTAEQLMKKEFKKALGQKALNELERSFRRSFIQESDMRQVAQWGFNSVRLPFNYRLIEEKPYVYSKTGAAYLDQCIAWGKKHGVYIILDLHAAPGAQNHDWHSDSLGKALLWKQSSFRRRTYALWEFLADRYKDEPQVAGYDLLNESVTDDTAVLNAFYQDLVKTIRRVDKNHILFIEGNRWSQDIAFLDEVPDDNWLYSIHFYEPLEFTFNFVPNLSYPLKSKAGVWDRHTMRKKLEGYFTFARKRKRPVHVGEFGVYDRAGKYGENKYLTDVVKCFNDFGFHWNYWTYKAVKHFMFPDGILSYYPNSPWVQRHGPVSGWNRWKDVWPTHKKDMIASWDSKQFSLNAQILKALT